MAILRGKCPRIAWPDSSIDNRRFPFGFRARREIFRRCAYGRVYDLLLEILVLRISVVQNSYLTKSKTDIRLPTGESRDVPSGVKRRLPFW